MSVIEFAYTKYRDMIVPMIPIKLKGQDRWFEFWAFVDSGATYSIFARKEAEGLGIDIYTATLKEWTHQRCRGRRYKIGAQNQ